MASSVDETEMDELAKRRKEEYEMQLFGLHSRSVYAVLRRTVEENVDLRCKQMYSTIEKKCNFDENKKEELKDCIKQLRKKYYQNMKPHLEALEKVVNKFICVPDHVLLEGDEAQAIQYTDEEFHQSEAELKDLQNQLKRAKMYNAALTEELETLDSLQESQELATKLCDIIEKNMDIKNISSKTKRSIERCKNLSKSLDAIQAETPKDIFNPKLNKGDTEPLSCDQDL